MSYLLSLLLFASPALAGTRFHFPVAPGEEVAHQFALRSGVVFSVRNPYGLTRVRGIPGDEYVIHVKGVKTPHGKPVRISLVEPEIGKFFLDVHFPEADASSTIHLDLQLPHGLLTHLKVISPEGKILVSDFDVPVKHQPRVFFLQSRREISVKNSVVTGGIVIPDNPSCPHVRCDLTCVDVLLHTPDIDAIFLYDKL